jgi:hypothetical protein
MAKQDEQNFDSSIVGAGDVEDEDESMSMQLANFSGDAEFDSGDIMFPRLRLMQGLSTEVQEGTASPGQWVLSGYEPVEEVTIVPMLFARNRDLRDDEGAVLCRSRDALVGEGEPGGNCAECPLSMWNEKIPPACSFSYVYAVYVKEFSTPAIVSFKRTSINAGKTLNTIVAQRKLRKFAVKLKASKQSGKRGTFYQAVVVPVQHDDDLIAAANNAMK